MPPITVILPLVPPAPPLPPPSRCPTSRDWQPRSDPGVDRPRLHRHHPQLVPRQVHRRRGGGAGGWLLQGFERADGLWVLRGADLYCLRRRCPSCQPLSCCPPPPVWRLAAVPGGARRLHAARRAARAGAGGGGACFGFGAVLPRVPCLQPAGGCQSVRTHQWTLGSPSFPTLSTRDPPPTPPPTHHRHTRTSVQTHPPPPPAHAAQVGRVRSCVNVPLVHARWVYNEDRRGKEVERFENTDWLEQVKPWFAGNAALWCGGREEVARLEASHWRNRVWCVFGWALGLLSGSFLERSAHLCLNTSHVWKVFFALQDTGWPCPCFAFCLPPSPPTPLHPLHPSLRLPAGRGQLPQQEPPPSGGLLRRPCLLRRRPDRTGGGWLHAAGRPQGVRLLLYVLYVRTLAVPACKGVSLIPSH